MDKPVGRQHIGEGDVHVWDISLKDDSSNYPLLDVPEFLSSAEISRYGRISRQLLRQRYLRSRTAMRIILAAYLDQQPADIRYCYNENGKPEIDRSANEQLLRFNLSHSNDRCLLAVTLEADVGIDVECYREGRDYMALARRFFSENELLLLENTSSSGLFHRMWVLKEAAVKARGLRLLAGLDRFECTLAEGGSLVVSDRCSEDSRQLWTNRQWQPDAGSFAAVTINNPAVVFVEQTFN
jgi:4'-phosphopantetheinyl transferase